jgi:hypothetical protein
LPAPDPWDPKDVASALEDAGEHWSAGKRDEALRALARAAAAAEQASLSERARALQAILAELEAPAAPPAVATAASGRPPPPSATRASTTPARAGGAASQAPLPPSARAAAAQQAPPAPQQAPPDTTTEVDGSNGKRTGLHVWVRTSARDPTLMLVRLLPDGHPAPPGAYEAYLSPMEEGVNLLSPKH